MDDASDATFDENLLYMPADEPALFRIRTVENAAAVKNNIKGEYELAVNTVNLSLVDQKTKKVVLIWPFRYIRRYGRTPTTFQFEAGRRCRSGEGLFSLKTELGVSDEIFNCIQARLSAMRQLDEQYAKNTEETPVSPTANRPLVPARQFSVETYQNVIAGAAQTKPSFHLKSHKVGTASSAPPMSSLKEKQNKLSHEFHTYAEVATDNNENAKLSPASYELADSSAPQYAAVKPVAKKPEKPPPAPPGKTAATKPATLPPAELNKLIAARRETLNRMGKEQSPGYGSVPGSATKDGKTPSAAYGVLYGAPEPTQYFLVSPCEYSEVVDPIHSDSLHSPGGGSK